MTLEEQAEHFLRWRDKQRRRTCPEAWRKAVDRRMKAEARARAGKDLFGVIPVDRVNERRLWVLGAMNDFCEADE